MLTAGYIQCDVYLSRSKTLFNGRVFIKLQPLINVFGHILPYILHNNNIQSKKKTKMNTPYHTQ